ncbi:DEAD/DEAH box helicase [Francisellaceae bacterium]|nr:DEAD/DEAH box helicase [Francisellaceae bacterium]
MTFNSLGLSSPIYTILDKKGYKKPTPIQSKAIPTVLQGKDVMASAQTGTGKTAAFALPILEKLSTQEQKNPKQIKALILTPTRELAAQVFDNFTTYGANLNLTAAIVFGGVKINPQFAKLKRGVDILVATPGRFLDLYNQGAINLKHVETFVLDEADRMLDMGFIPDIRKVISYLPKQRQCLLFSATFSPEIRVLAKSIMSNPVEVSVNQSNSTAAKIDQIMHPVDKSKKTAALLNIITENNIDQALVFTRTKHGANKLATFLEKNKVKAAAIHGNKSQGARTKALADFKSNQIQVLVATDIAARGLDINLLPHVFNFDLPNVPEDYVHRIGRTGRAGANGQAISLVCADEIKELLGIEKLLKQKLPRTYLDDFMPEHEIPTSMKNVRINKNNNQFTPQKKRPRRSYR